jgi:hypothetical protein
VIAMKEIASGRGRWCDGGVHGGASGQQKNGGLEVEGQRC